MDILVVIVIFLFAIPIYFFSKWILKKGNFFAEKNRKYIAIIPTIILAPTLYVLIVLIWFFSISYYPDKDFDKEKWATDKEKRYEMTESIIDDKILIGKTKPEVVALLGTNFGECEENHISYDIGYIPGLFNIDPSFLDIFFENGKVVKVSQHES